MVCTALLATMTANAFIRLLTAADAPAYKTLHDTVLHSAPEAFVSDLASALIAAGDTGAAQQAIETQLAHAWDSRLAGLYGRCEGGDVRARLACAEDWLKRQPRDPQLLLSLGRLCVQSQLWGKAESYLEASLAIAPSWEAHVELAHLAERMDRTDAANRHYRAAAEQARG